MWILLLAGIGIGAYLIVQNMHAKQRLHGSEDAPLEILKKRYARGEITKDEFERMRRSL